jgi:hypothetical protein
MFAPGGDWYNKIRSIKLYKGALPKQPRLAFEILTVIVET